jgi:hypothetical protein
MPSTTVLPTHMLPTVDTKTMSHTISTISKWPLPSSRQMAPLRLLRLLRLARPPLHPLAQVPHRLHLLVQVAVGTARYVVRISSMLVLITDISIAGPSTPWSISQNLFWWVNIVPSTVQSQSI